MMGTDNITCPSEGPVAGCAVGVLASAGRRDFGPQLAAVRVSCGLGPGSLGWSTNALARRNADHRLPGGSAVCGRTARTVWEGAGGNALTMPGPCGSPGGMSVARLSSTSLSSVGSGVERASAEVVGGFGGALASAWWDRGGCACDGDQQEHGGAWDRGGAVGGAVGCGAGPSRGGGAAAVGGVRSGAGGGA